MTCPRVGDWKFDRMRIMHLVNHCIRGHGNAHVAVELACQQAKNGDDVLYLSEGGSLEPLLTEAGVGHRYLVQKTKNPLQAAASLSKLIATIVAFKADVVHAHMMSGAVLGYAATRMTLKPLMTTIHNSFDSHSRLMKLGDLAVAVSGAEREALLQRGFDPRRTVSIVNGPLGGARLNRFRDDPPLKLARPSISTVCGLHERKGVNDLINAFSLVAGRFPDAHLNIVGEGPDQSTLEQLCAKLNLSQRVTFHGSLDNPMSVLKATDIFVLSSHREPLGLANIEARSAGCAVIGTDVDGIPEALDFGAAGILVPPRDPQSLADAMAELLGNPDRLANRKAAASENLTRFTIDHLYEQYRSAYASAERQRRFGQRRMSASLRSNS